MIGIGHCNKCGREIVWIRTKKGKNMPCDSLPVKYWRAPHSRDSVMTDSGELVRAHFDGLRGTADGKGYRPHFGTCPKRVTSDKPPAERWESPEARKRRERREKEKAEAEARERKAAEKREFEARVREAERAQYKLFDF